MNDEHIEQPFDYPFQPKKLEEDRENRDQVNVALDEELRALVNKVKGSLNMPQDAAAMKLMLEAGGNAILGTFSVKTWKKVSDKDRVRLSRSQQEKLIG